MEELQSMKGESIHGSSFSFLDNNRIRKVHGRVKRRCLAGIADHDTGHPANTLQSKLLKISSNDCLTRVDL
ncbi:hypothetical protein BaRGS_00001284, partial [Batillaria attramentaria]